MQLLTSPTFPGPRAFTPKCTARAGGSPSFLVFFPREPGHILGASARVSFNVLSLPGRTGVALAVFGMRRSSRSPREASVQRRNVSLDTVHCDLRACYNALSLSAFVPRRCGEPPCPHRPQRFMPTTLLAWFLPPSLSPPPSPPPPPLARASRAEWASWSGLARAPSSQFGVHLISACEGTSC